MQLPCPFCERIFKCYRTFQNHERVCNHRTSTAMTNSKKNQKVMLKENEPMSAPSSSNNTDESLVNNFHIEIRFYFSKCYFYITNARNEPVRGKIWAR